MVMIADGFWGLRIEPKKTYTNVVEEPFRVSMASLGPSESSKDGSRTSVIVSVKDQEYVLSNLRVGGTEQQQLDITFTQGEEVTFMSKGDCPVDLVGNYVVNAMDMEDGLDSFIDDEAQEGAVSDEEEEEVETKAVTKKGKAAVDDEEEGDDEPSINELKALLTSGKLSKDDSEELKELIAEMEEEGDDDDEEEVEPSVEELKALLSSGKLSEEEAQELKDFLEAVEEEGEDDVSDEEEPSLEELKELLASGNLSKEEADELKEVIEEMEQGDDETAMDSDDNDDSQEDIEMMDESEMQKVLDSLKRKAEVSPAAATATSVAEKKVKAQDGTAKPAAAASAEKPLTKKEKKQKQKEAAAAAAPAVSPAKAEVKKETAASATSTKKTLPNGLIIEDIVVGKGPKAKKGKKVCARYIGKLMNGKVFDSNTSGKPFSFKLGAGQVIKGWDMGFDGMSVGSTRKLTIPAALAYGSRGAPPDIPPNSTLQFEVKLLDVKN